MGLTRKTANFVERGITDDDRRLGGFGVDGLHAEALPYYARWVRQDLVGIFFLLTSIARTARFCAVLLVLITAALWIIALR